jgi:GntR family transcriptional regulator
LLLTIHPDDGLPIYRQIVRQVTHAVASGAIAPGEKMPSQRELAGELVINHLTVKKAYETLEARGIIETRRGLGTFVSGSLPADLRRRGLKDLRDRAIDLAATAKLLKVDLRALQRTVADAWRENRESSS